MGELSHDGLVPLQDTDLTGVWIRRGYPIGNYTKVMLSGVEIQYRPVRPSSVNISGSPAGELPIGPQERKELKQLVTAEFDSALERLALEQVTEAGPDVLTVRGYLLDVVSKAPVDPASGAQYWLDTVGEATFVVELIDSQSNAVLLRALDTRSTESQIADPVIADSQVRQLVSLWADMLVDALNDLDALGQSAPGGRE